MTRFLLRWMFRILLLAIVVMALWVVAYKWINPPTTFYIQQESARRGGITHTWVDMDNIAPVVARAVVAAEDANFCNHGGVDWDAVRQAWSEGARRGGSTISQQTIKNAFLWQGSGWNRWLRKGLEVVITPFADWVWGKERMLEIYLNIIEFDTKVFGIEAAAWHHYGRSAADLNRVQAGRLAAVLPNPRDYEAVNPSPFIRDRAASIIAGSDMIRRDKRARCFED